MTCSKCNTEIGEANFCSSCGAAVVTVGAYGAPPPAVGQGMPQQYGGFASTPPMSYAPPRVSFGQAISAGFRGYVVWNARSTRAEYWWWTLFNVLVLAGALVIDAVATGGFLYLLGVFALFLPNLSVLIRRLHDIDKNGGWFWIGLIPLVGPIVLLVFALTPSTPAPVRWNRSLVV